MYIIGWTDVNGGVHAVAHLHPLDAVACIRAIEASEGLRGLGLQCEDVADLLRVIRLMDGSVPFDEERHKPLFASIAGAAIEFGLTQAPGDAPFTTATTIDRR